MTKRLGARAAWIEERGPLIAALVFFACGLCWLGSSARFHGDERYYTDSALRMLEYGDPWTPRWADGAVRANKPLLTYWVVLASFATAGVSFFVARLPFLVAGALLVWLTGRLTRTLFPTERAAPFLAALIVASDYEVVTLARRSTPDILLMLFIAASLCGLARMVVAGERSRSAAAWFWIGLGLAIATKGGLGVLLLAFGCVAILLTRRGAPWKSLFPPLTCALGLVIALVGLGPSLFAGSNAGGVSFVDDQVGARVAASVGVVARQLLDYAGSLTKHFLPWVIFVIVGFCVVPRAARARWRSERKAIVLALAWVALLWLVFSLSNTHRGRYLAPAHAPLAALMALFLLDVATTAWGRRSAWVLSCALLAVTVLAAVLVARVDLATGVALLAPLCLFGIGARFVRDGAAVFRALALSILAATTIAHESLLALVDPSPFPLATARLEHATGGASACATLALPDTAAGRVRVLSGGRLNPRSFPESVPDSELQKVGPILARSDQWERLRRLGLEVEPLPQSATNFDLELAIRLFWRGEDWQRTLFVDPALGIGQSIGTFR